MNVVCVETSSDVTYWLRHLNYSLTQRCMYIGQLHSFNLRKEEIKT